jgi:hypothetical protein
MRGLRLASASSPSNRRVITSGRRQTFAHAGSLVVMNGWSIPSIALSKASISSTAILAATHLLASVLALSACEKKEETPVAPAVAASVVAAAITPTVAPLAPAVSAMPVATLAPAAASAHAVLTGKAPPAKTADGGAAVVAGAKDGGAIVAAAPPPPSLSSHAAAIASAVGIALPTAMPSTITIPSTITLPTALPPFPGAPDAAK